MIRVNLIASVAVAVIAATIGSVAMANAEPMQRSARGALAIVHLAPPIELKQPIARGSSGVAASEGMAVRIWGPRGATDL